MSESDPKTPSVETQGQQLAEQILGSSGAKAGVDGQIGSENGEAQSSETTPSPLTGKVTVDYGGAAREVDISELVEAHLSRSKLEEREREVNERFEAAGLGSKIARHLDRLPEERRAQIFNLLEGNEASNGASRSYTSSEDEMNDLVGELMGEGQRNGSEDDGLREVVKRLAETQQVILSRYQDEDRKATERSIQQTLTEKLESFPVVQDLRKLAKAHEGADAGVDLILRSAMNDLAQNPSQSVDHLLAGYVTKLNKMTQAQLNNAARSGGSPMAADDLPGARDLSPEARSGAGLESGKMLKELQSRFGFTR